MERLNFTIIDGKERPLHEPRFVENRTDIPIAVMDAVNDFLEAYDGELALPLRIEVTASAEQARPVVPAPVQGFFMAKRNRAERAGP